MLVACQYGGFLLIEVRTTEVVVVVASRVVVNGVVNIRIHLALDSSQIVGVDAIAALVGIRQSVQTNILLLSCAALRGEGINHTLGIWNASPCRFEVVRTIHRHTALVEFLTVLQDVLAHVAQVDVEVAAIVASLVATVNEWVEQPELYVLHVGSLEVVGVELAHHTAPSLRRVIESSALIYVGVQVVRTSLTWVVSQVEDWQRVALALVHILVWIYFTNIHLSHVMVGELVEVALEVSWCKRRITTSEEWVDVVPCQERTVVAIFCVVRQVAVLHFGWRGGESPCLWSALVYAALGRFEVIDVGGIALHTTCLSSDELCHFGRERDARRLCHVDERNLVENIGQPLRLLLPVQIQSPDGVVQWLATHAHFRGKCLLLEAHECTA